MRVPDLSGLRFGFLTVIQRVGSRGGHSAWECRCDCGTIKTVTAGNLKAKTTISCGCANTRRIKEFATRHARFGTPEYRSWTGMKERCGNPTSARYRYWGGRGITVCAEWRDDFMAFYRHIGPKPGPNYSIDRINNDGNYEPGNVRWATPYQQTHNRRKKSANPDALPVHAFEPADAA